MGYFALAMDKSLKGLVQNVIDNCNLFLNRDPKEMESNPMTYLLETFALPSLKEAIKECYRLEGK